MQSPQQQLRLDEFVLPGLLLASFFGTFLLETVGHSYTSLALAVLTVATQPFPLPPVLSRHLTHAAHAS